MDFLSFYFWLDPKVTKDQGWNEIVFILRKAQVRPGDLLRPLRSFPVSLRLRFEKMQFPSEAVVQSSEY